MSIRKQIDNLNAVIKHLESIRDELVQKEEPPKPIDLDLPPNEALHRAGYGSQHVDAIEEESDKEK